MGKSSLNLEKLRLVSTNICGHLLHLGLLIVPSMILRSSSQWDLGLVLFSMVILVAGIAEGFSVLRVQTLSRECDVARRNRDGLAMTIAQVAGALMLVTFWFAQVETALFKTSSLGLMPIGLPMAVTGILLRATAILSLGSNFVSDIRCDTEVIKTGIYRVLRHPSEYGLLLVSVGAPLMLGATFSALFAAVTLVPISVWRMLREDSFLASLNVRQPASKTLSKKQKLSSIWH